jgi:penicillin-insensitive murein endopeptidase
MMADLSRLAAARPTNAGYARFGDMRVDCLRRGLAHRSLNGMRRFVAAALLLACSAARDADNSSSPPPEPAAKAAATAPASVEPPSPPEVPGGGPDPLALDGAHSTSVGNPNEGSLQGGVPLPLHGPGYRFTPRKKPERRHGTVELVAALVRAAGVVAHEMPGSTLTFGDIGMPEGGPIAGHGSHRAGRDADVMFYLLDEQGKPADGIAVPLDLDGNGTDYNDLADPADDVPLRIDVPRTWRFVQALLEDDTLQIQQIFIVEHLRAMLLAHADEVGAPEIVRRRFGDVTCQPGFPHDDHMHVRVFCTAQDIAGGCEDVRPIFPWQRELLAKAGSAPVMAGKRKTKRQKLTSVTEAREKAGPMHASVVEFLDRREAWAKKPHPGRPYCK